MEVEKDQCLVGQESVAQFQLVQFQEEDWSVEAKKALATWKS